MPNHVTNILTVSGDADKMQAVFEAIKSDDIGLGSIDFNKVIPMPEHIFRGNCPCPADVDKLNIKYLLFS